MTALADEIERAIRSHVSQGQWSLGLTGVEKAVADILALPALRRATEPASPAAGEEAGLGNIDVAESEVRAAFRHFSQEAEYPYSASAMRKVIEDAKRAALNIAPGQDVVQMSRATYEAHCQAQRKLGREEAAREIDALKRRCGEVEKLRALSEKATAGVWYHYDEVFRKQLSRRRITEIQREADGRSIIRWAGFDGLDPSIDRKKNHNARFIVACVNFVRSLIQENRDA